MLSVLLNIGHVVLSQPKIVSNTPCGSFSEEQPLLRSENSASFSASVSAKSLYSAGLSDLIRHRGDPKLSGSNWGVKVREVILEQISMGTVFVIRSVTAMIKFHSRIFYPGCVCCAKGGTVPKAAV